MSALYVIVCQLRRFTSNVDLFCSEKKSSTTNFVDALRVNFILYEVLGIREENHNRLSGK